MAVSGRQVCRSTKTTGCYSGSEACPSVADRALPLIVRLADRIGIKSKSAGAEMSHGSIGIIGAAWKMEFRAQRQIQTGIVGVTKFPRAIVELSGKPNAYVRPRCPDRPEPTRMPRDTCRRSASRYQSRISSETYRSGFRDSMKLVEDRSSHIGLFSSRVATRRLV